MSTAANGGAVDRHGAGDLPCAADRLGVVAGEHLVDTVAGLRLGGGASQSPSYRWPGQVLVGSAGATSCRPVRPLLPSGLGVHSCVGSALLAGVHRSASSIVVASTTIEVARRRACRAVVRGSSRRRKSRRTPARIMATRADSDDVCDAPGRGFLRLRGLIWGEDFRRSSGDSCKPMGAHGWYEPSNP